MPDFLREAIKILICLLGYTALAPGLGVAAAFRPFLRPLLVGAMFACAALPPGWFTLTIFSQDWYRGHVRGWQCSLVEILALALIIETFIARRDHLRGVLAVLIPFFLYIALCSLSIFTAWDTSFALMAWFKYGKGLLILAGAYCAIRTPRDVEIILWVLAGALFLQFGFGLWQRYVEHVWRVRALFEHSNPMAMWAYGLGVILFATSLRPGLSVVATLSWLMATALAGGLIILSLARASLAAMAAGIAAAIIGTALHARSVRLLAVTGWIVVAGMLMTAIAYDSIRERLTTAAISEVDGDLRPVLVDQARAMHRDHMLGVGWNNFCVANSRPQGAVYSEILEDWNRARGHRILEEDYLANPMTESLWWLHRAETGYPGLVGLILFMAWTVILALNAWWRHRKETIGGVCLGILLTLGLYYAHGFVERILIEPKNFSTWLLLVALAARLRRMPVASTTAVPMLSPMRSLPRNTP